MNRRRTEHRGLGMGSMVLLITAALVMAGAGMFHAYIKNRQIQVRREIDATERRIDETELRIRTLQMQLDEELNYALIRDRLRRMGSRLRPISETRVLEIDPLQPTPPLPDLAQGP